MGGGSFDCSPSSPAREMCMESGVGGRGIRRRGAGSKTTKQQQQQKAPPTATKQHKQPQRGLGVAQLEKIRLHNQMMAAYRSAAEAQAQSQSQSQQLQIHDHHQYLPLAAVPVPVPAAAPPGAGCSGSAVLLPSHSSDVSMRAYMFQNDHRCRLEETTTTTTDRGVVVPGLHCYDGGLLAPYMTQTTPPPSLYAHDVRDSSGHRLGHPPHQDSCWRMMMSSSSSSRSDDDGSIDEDELDLELRL